MMNKQLAIKCLKAVLAVLEEPESTNEALPVELDLGLKTDDKADYGSVIDKPLWLQNNSSSQATRVFAQGVISFFQAQGYLSEKQVGMVCKTHAAQCKCD